MPDYTLNLQNKSRLDLFDLEDPHEYIEILKSTAKSFRSLDEALASFVSDHGYDGNINDKDSVIRFIAERFRNAGISVPRKLKQWFTRETLSITKKTAYQFCFAFGLDLEETGDFFRRICLLDGIDYHDPDEIVYSFCLKNGISYSKAVEMATSLNGSCVANCAQDLADVPYTAVIRTEIEKVSSEEELLNYLRVNRDMFERNKLTASEYIKKLWGEISSVEGLAATERKNRFYDQFAELWFEKQGRNDKEEDIWAVLKQILGIDYWVDNDKTNDRSIKYILKDNEVLHRTAEEDFPDRQAINLILNDKHVSSERMRKVLILLSFYAFWAESAKCGTYSAPDDQKKRCIRLMNQYLVECGFTEMYYGNPYDWIFLMAMGSDAPLSTFREFIGILFESKGENLYEHQ